MIAEREAFVAAMRELDPTKLVFIDESGFRTGVNRHYGWAPCGEKPVIVASRYGRNITLVGAIAVDGVRALTVLESAMDGSAFVRFLDKDLGPTLRPGDVVVMDGPRVHRVEGVVEALARWGAKPLYLPRYSPELNPIEMCWSVLKAWVRTRAPRLLDQLIAAAREAWGNVTALTCMAWVRHCGYAVCST